MDTTQTNLHRYFHRLPTARVLVVALGLLLLWTANATAFILRPGAGRFFAITPRTSASAAAMNGPAAARSGWSAIPALAGDPFSSTYTAAVDRYLTDVALASQPSSPAIDNVYSVTAQYPAAAGDDGSPTTMVSASFNASADAITDSDTFPADAANGNPAGCQEPSTVQAPSDPPYTWCLTDAQIQAELESVIAARHLPSDLTAVYYVLVGPGVDVCTSPGGESSTNPCADKYFCSYHSSFTVGNGNAPPVYAVIPWPDVSGCTSGEAPNGSGGDDPGDDAANVISHEGNEAVTDPLGSGWFAGGGLEVADLCARTSEQPRTIFGPALGGVPEAAYNQEINGDRYWLQEEYSLVDAAKPSADGTCEQRPANNNASEAANVRAPALAYHGGAVIGAHTTYAIFWEPTGNGQIPSAAFSVSTSTAHIGQPVSFTAADTSDPQGLGLSYAWNFGDGSSTTTALASVSHAYTLPGAHVVRLSVSDPDGYAASSSQMITVYRPPTASFTGPSAVIAGRAASFNAQTSGDLDGTIERWWWSFGDGGAASGPLVTHVFAHPGPYMVTLALTDSNDSSASDSQTVPVLAQPVARIARAGSPRVSLSHGRLLVLTGRLVSCPATALGCRVRVILSARVSTAEVGSRHPTTHTVKLATASLSIPAGHGVRIVLHLNGGAVALLRRLRRLSCALTLKARTEEGIASAATIALKLLAPHSLPRAG
jgi:chitodextrinase